jgi:hypothetical protein
MGDASDAGRSDGAGGNAGADGSAGGTGGGTAGTVVTGTIMGMTFPVAKAYWIGVPDPALPPVNFFLLEPPFTCAEISTIAWDKAVGTKKVLEVSLADMAAKAHTIGADVIANYLAGSYNPDATGGKVTVTAANPNKNLVGTFELTFGADTINGTFDAEWCPTGVTP